MVYTKGYNLKKESLIKKATVSIKERGFKRSLIGWLKWKYIAYIKIYLLRLHHVLYKSKFYVGKNEFSYFIHRNNSIDSERTIEIPFSYWFVKEHHCIPDKFLELGNTLNQYFNIPHIVVDKYEIAKGVINEDIIDFEPKKKFKLIVSISTVEHIGFDEPQKEDGKAIEAIKKLMGMLDEKGFLLITVPLGYNPEIDRMLKEKKISFTEMYFMRRTSRWNLWEETTLEDAISKKYNSIYPAANAVAFLIYKK